MPWSIVGAVAAPVVGGLVSSAVGGSSGGGEQGTQAAEQVADPFASQRGQYQKMLQMLMTPGSNYTSQDPGYQWQVDQGMKAIQRTMAAQGLSGSGNEMQELLQYSQGLASNDYQAAFNRLALLSGANINGTGEAGQIAAGGVQQANTGAGVIGNAIGSGINKLGNYLSGGSGNSGGFNTDYNGFVTPSSGFNLSGSFGNSYSFAG